MPYHDEENFEFYNALHRLQPSVPQGPGPGRSALTDLLESFVQKQAQTGLEGWGFNKPPRDAKALVSDLFGRIEDALWAAGTGGMKGGRIRPPRILPELTPRQTKSGLPVVKVKARELDIEPLVRSLRRYYPYSSERDLDLSGKGPPPEKQLHKDSLTPIARPAGFYESTDELMEGVDLYGPKYLEGSDPLYLKPRITFPSKRFYERMTPSPWGRPLKRKNIRGHELAHGQAEVLKKESPKRYRRIWNDALRALWEGTPLRYITRPGKPPRINENLRGPASIRVSGIKIPAGSFETALLGLKKNILELKEEGFSYEDIIKDDALPAIYSRLDPYNEIVTEALHIMHQEYIRKFRKSGGKPSPRSLRWDRLEAERLMRQK